ncbi:XKR6-like protein [Mya arenaria]|uniref:XK-related protein n=1 Tax=Mya arenaria TaxID=6604 RepID=A0ABY7FLP4_MYAAR|nr:XKR6-like protein [Mya arenaria]
MASKKKLPRSRRCNNSENFAVNCYCITDEPDLVTEACDAPCCVDQDTGDSTSNVKYEEFDNVSQKNRVKLQKDDIHRGPSFDYLDIIIGLSSIAFFFFDVVTDVLLARDYFHQGRMWPFGLTAAFVIGPNGTFLTMKANNGWSSNMVLKIQIEYIYNGIKSSDKKLPPKERERHYKVMRCEDVDACCIRMFECFLEAAPQLMLQIYILMEYREKEGTWLIEGIRAASILSSWASLSWCMVSYHKSLRLSHTDKENMRIPGMMLCFLWRATEIGPRVIALGMFASQFSWGVFIVVGVHWLLMSMWLVCQNTKFYQNRCEEKCFNFVCGYVLVFCFLNVRDGRTRYRMMLFYFIFYAENWCMMGFWFYFTEDKSEWFYLPAFFAVTLSVFLHLFFQLTYYQCFHPLGSGKIPCCLHGTEEYSCFQSMCHELEPTERPYLENQQVVSV